MQILGRDGEDFPFFSKLTPLRVVAPTAPVEVNVQEQTTPSLASLEFVSKATSALRNASSRAKRALVELKDDIVSDIFTDFGGAPQQTLSQGPGWALPWGVRTEEDRQREETRRRIRELSKEPHRFLVPPVPGEDAADTPAVLGLEGELLAASRAAMEADPSLRALRDDLVPRMVKEVEFWQRYFKAVRDTELEVFRKFTPFNSSQGFSTPETVSLNSGSVSTNTSTETSNSTWLGGKLVSPVRPFNVDDEDEGAVIEPLPFIPRRSVSEQADNVVQLLWNKSHLSGGQNYFQPLSETPGRTRPSGEAFTTGLLMQLSGLTAEAPQEEVSVRKEEDDLEGPLNWLMRTLSGASSGAGTGTPEGGEGYSALELPEGVPSTSGRGTPRRNVKAALEEAVLPDLGGDMPPSSAVVHLHRAMVFVAGYRTWAELAGGAGASAWSGLSGLPLVGSTFRRQLVPRSQSSPGHVKAPRDSCLDGGDPIAILARYSLLEHLFRSERQQRQQTDPVMQSVGKHFTCFTRMLHGAPPGSFVSELALAMAQITSAQEMARLWLEVVDKLRWHFRVGQPIPGVPLEMEHPDLQLCEVMQHVQLLNLCMKRRKSRTQRFAEAALKDFDKAVDTCGRLGREQNSQFPTPCSQRRGEGHVLPGVFLLETGEPLFVPETQDTPLMTETSVRETEEQIILTGQMGSGCEQLFSDMQAFKAANPGCILEDFVRWYSPPDWSPVPYSPVNPSGQSTSGPVKPSGQFGSNGSAADGRRHGTPVTSEVSPMTESDETVALSSRGYLSIRMTFAGNLWQELWGLAEPIAALEQVPLFDVEEGGECSLKWLEDVSPSELLEQLFITLVSEGLEAAHTLPEAVKEPLKTSLAECSSYITAVCSRGIGIQKQRMVCAIYEVLEAARATTQLPSLFDAQLPISTEGGRAHSDSDSSVGDDAGEQVGFRDTVCGALSVEESVSTDDVGPLQDCRSSLEVQPSLADKERSQDDGQVGQGQSSVDRTTVVRGGCSVRDFSVPKESLPSAPVESGGGGALPSANIRQAATAFFQKVRSAPSWARPGGSKSSSEIMRGFFQPVARLSLERRPTGSADDGHSLESVADITPPRTPAYRTPVAKGSGPAGASGPCSSDEPRVQIAPEVSRPLEARVIENKLGGAIANEQCLPQPQNDEPSEAASLPRDKELDSEWVIL